MGLNTDFMVFKNISSENISEKTKNILSTLKFETISKLDLQDFAEKARILYNNTDSIAITYFNGNLVFEHRSNIFEIFSRPLILKDLSKINDIFLVTIADTIDASIYSVYSNGDFFSKSFGMEDIDLSFLDSENDIQPYDSYFVENKHLEPLLDEFIKAFDYENIFEQKCEVWNIKDLEEIEKRRAF
jgi:hypothetical protein